MADVVSPALRSRMMAGIHGKDTKPELTIRTGLFARGFRYRLHQRDLPGTPDLVLRRYRAVVFVHGCFWHAHDCDLFRMPSSNREFWKAKLKRNQDVDRDAMDTLERLGWRLCVVWECSLKGPGRLAPDTISDRVANWLLSSRSRLVVSGTRR